MLYRCRGEGGASRHLHRCADRSRGPAWHYRRDSALGGAMEVRGKVRDARHVSRSAVVVNLRIGKGILQAEVRNRHSGGRRWVTWS